MPEKPSAKILRCWPAMRKIGMLFKIERCETPAIRTPAAVWPAMRTPAMPNPIEIASDAGRAMRTTKGSHIALFSPREEPNGT